MSRLYSRRAEGNDVLVELVTTDAQAAADHDPTQADDGDLRRAAADVDDQAAGRLAHRQSGTDGRGHGLLDEPRPAGTGAQGGIANSALLDLGHATWDADQHSRPVDHPDAVVHATDEVLEHLLGHVEVADDAVAQRTYRDDVGRSSAEHPLRLGTDRQHALGARLDRDHGRLADDDAPAADVHQRVGRAQVDAYVA